MKNSGASSTTKIIFGLMLLLSVFTLAYINPPPTVEDPPPCESELQAMNEAEAALNAAKQAAAEAYANWLAKWRARNNAKNKFDKVEHDYQKIRTVGGIGILTGGLFAGGGIAGGVLGKLSPASAIGSVISTGVFAIWGTKSFFDDYYLPTQQALELADAELYEANQAKLQTKHAAEAAQELFDAAKTEYDSCMSG
jgi:hypothetical protein